MQIDERVVDGVTILDLKGKMTLGEGDELLKDKINSLIQQDQEAAALNLEDVPYIDSAGLGEIVRTYTTVSRQGGKLKLLNLTKRIQDLLAITKLLTVFETYDSEAEAIKSFKQLAHGPPRGNSRRAQMARHSHSGHHRADRAASGAGASASRRGRWRSSLARVAAAVAVDEEPHRLRRADVRPAAAGRRARSLLSPARRVRHLLRAVGRRLSHQRRRGSGGRSAASAQEASADRVRRGRRSGRRSATAAGRSAAPRSAAAFWLRPAFGAASARPTSRCSPSTPGRSSTSSSSTC